MKQLPTSHKKPPSSMLHLTPLPLQDFSHTTTLLEFVNYGADLAS